jgi:1-acyl-sn-glycerol-3-phosphate acyltransferase
MHSRSGSAHQQAEPNERPPTVRGGYRFCRFCCQWFCTLYFKPRAYGTKHVPTRGGVLLVANHQSFMDPALATIAIQREADFMARDSLFAHPGFGKLIKYLNAFPVRRQTADLNAVKEALRRLKQGRLLLLFPEGTRTEDGRIQPFLPGLGAIARKARVPIVPTLIDGVHAAWPRDRVLPSPGNVIVEYDRPITPEAYADLSVEQLMETVRGRIIALQRKWHDRLPERRLREER